MHPQECSDETGPSSSRKQETLPVPEALELDTQEAWDDFQNSQLEFDRWYVQWLGLQDP